MFYAIYAPNSSALYRIFQFLSVIYFVQWTYTCWDQHVLDVNRNIVNQEKKDNRLSNVRTDPTFLSSSFLFPVLTLPSFEVVLVWIAGFPAHRLHLRHPFSLCAEESTGSTRPIRSANKTSSVMHGAKYGNKLCSQPLTFRWVWTDLLISLGHTGYPI
ncbi:hypothetical protein AVEN_144003-1 [Araneus ventricosus]|uniref:Uncharacterized protein n=1 Tax=Araneus ventricosus TaxID=182803 RepID=A0A4Y1ZKF9_ARAVE|nr:hypothetical protein AVEN_144003-1 [Araneus ventricosus]